MRRSDLQKQHWGLKGTWPTAIISIASMQFSPRSIGRSTPANISILPRPPSDLPKIWQRAPASRPLSHRNVREIFFTTSEARTQKSRVGYWFGSNPMFDRTPLLHHPSLHRPIIFRRHHASLPTSISSASPSMSKDSIDVPVLSRTQATLRPTLPLTAIEKPTLLLL